MLANEMLKVLYFGPAELGLYGSDLSVLCAKDSLITP